MNVHKAKHNNVQSYGPVVSQSITWLMKAETKHSVRLTLVFMHVCIHVIGHLEAIKLFLLTAGINPYKQMRGERPVELIRNTDVR